MPRISLVEAYNNRDVIAWLVKHQDAIDEMMNILQNVNPDGDLTNIVLKTGDQTIDGVKTFIGTIVANCDIIQNGAAYETHAEQLFTKNDYIVMRDGALGGLQPGEFSGFRVNRYDSVHDGHLVMDSGGTARVGDVGDERPLLVRDEAADLTDGDLLQWVAADQKAAGLPVSSVVDMARMPEDMSSVKVSVVFGTNGPGGIFESSFIGLYNADQKTIACTAITVTGISTPDPSNVTVVKTKLGFYLKLNDSSASGRVAIATMTIS